ncbi:N-acetylmuramoyl-L-alanine amidase [Breznakia sp. PF5-3]|uniref:N-acetylmuramoyl-L-alanine amidase n=1 Tax=unclassified Breznakia TaxID=2623764 RepID=UPI002406F235|nr:MULTISPECIES: N-acetylmuramoyl-L-alanine amidase [unclassified Breznakia]MDL2276408.1 N-acetylmuramoyl-L-alanine amidase [Breznakia sp. OttesenSCG-928-G09]MDF9823794.1 N-acetylmuramoyl-L-alanine amidase [Breznakia sp. PM6-1]MDF9834640.1 N-acetylmuramoyl-L-alanine amidase [Breznakia sp. PF5-3]MDF9836743.1 N-acetylmuramoyl-L-alanine amidase [Breznakia sp. PFB2-8]MDF9858808.1 N-acetylmuramoyl-L-alanine amidase [Breznakia sp. PH5-24]
MAYIPKKRKLKLNYKVAVPLLILTIFIAYFAVNLLLKETSVTKENYSVCDFSNEKTKTVLDKKFKDTYAFNDYLFYGESLSLFKDTYTGEDSDDMSGKTLKLKDVCSDQTYAFVLDRKVDRRILLGNIKPGFYEMYLVEDLKEKRLYANDTISESIYTVTRNGKNTKVEFIANQKLLADYKVTLQQPYAFLNVQEKKVAKNEYDIVIDPAGNDNSLSNGASGNGISEAEEAYKAAKMLKEKLEAKGLKVLILRDENEKIDTYGKNGRLAKAYQVRAKYYIRLGFAEDGDSNLHGFNIFYSEHSTKMLASQIGYDFGKKTKLEGSTIYMGVNDDVGVISAGLVESELDGRSVYDGDLYVRETGGKATQAGMYSEHAKEGTASFAKDNIYGMNAINLYFGFISNKSDITYWKEEKELIIDVLANSITTYLNIEE